MSQGAAGALSGAYNENTDAVKKLTEQIKSWQGNYSNDALNVNEEELSTPEITPPTGGGSISPPNRFGGGGGGQSFGATAGAIGGTLGKNMLANMASNKTLGKLIAENTYVQLGSYMGNANAGTVLRQAVGSGGNGYNWIANSTQDAMQQFNILQQASGTQVLNSTSLGRSLMGASFGAGYLIPGMSGTQSAQFASQVMSPQTSLALRRFGINPLPQYMKGPVGSLGQLAQNITSKMLNGGTMAPAAFANLMKDNGAGQLSYNFVTGGSIPFQTMRPIMEAVNTLRSRGANPQQIDWALNNAGHGNKAAAQFLQQHGINETDILALHQALAPNMARTADQYTGMQQGLIAATTAVQVFNTQFSKFMKESGLDTPTGIAEGITGTTNALEPGLGTHAGHLVKSAAHAYVAQKLIRSAWKFGKNILGRGAADGADAAAAGDAGAAGDAAATGAEGAGAGAAGVAGVGIAAAGAGIALGSMFTGHYTPHPPKTSPKNRGVKGHKAYHAWKQEWIKWMRRQIASGEMSPRAELIVKRGGIESLIGRLSASDPTMKHVNVRGGGASGPPRTMTNPASVGAGGSTSGQDIVNYAKQFIGHPYSLGGSGDYQSNHNAPYGPWDCAGFVSQMYEHFGLGPIRQVNVEGLMAWGKKTQNPVVGGFVTYVTDGSVAVPGHVGLITGPNSTIQAMDPALGTRASDLGTLGHPNSGGPVAFYVPPNGFTGSGVSPGGGGGGSTTYNIPKSNGGGNGFGVGNGTGDDITGGSQTEKAAFLSAITGGAHGGSGYYGQNNGVFFQVTTNGGGGAAPSGGNGSLVNPIPRGVRPERVDQGVDFAGNGNILAMGDATIGITNGGGWPGGPYMSYQLDAGGKWVYVAENIRPTVRPGQKVKKGDVIAKMFDGGTGIETGWAAPGGGSPLSQTAAAGGISGANLPGNGSTAIGMNYEKLLVSLGAPKAPNYGAPSGGKVPPGYAAGGDIEVHHAHKTAKFAAPDYTYSTMHPVYSGGRDLLPSNTQIILRFKKDSIKFIVPPSTQSDTGASKKSTMNTAMNAVNTRRLNTSVSRGVK